MVRETKLYDLLGVASSASDADIKKAYRKMALKYHPDKPTGDAEKFKEISEAFQILSDSEKREVYDQYGLDAARGNAPQNPFANGGGQSAGGNGGFHFNTGGSGYHQFTQDDAFNMFNQFGGFEDLFGGSGGRGGSPFGGMGSMPGGMGGMGGMPGGMGGGMPRQKQPEAEVIELNAPCSLEELYNGGKKLKINRKGPRGESESKIFSINLKRGWKAGTKLTYPNEGDYKNGVRQTIKFVITEKKDDRFVRKDNDLIATVEISFKESLLGFTKEITTLSGRKLNITRSTPTQPNSTERYPNQGMPISKQPGTYGDLIVNFKIDYPIFLSPEQKNVINANF